MTLNTTSTCGAAKYGDVARANFEEIESRLVALEGTMPIPVADVTALGGLDTTNLQDGALVYVRDPGDIYLLDKTNSYTVDSPFTIAGNGGGYWLSRVAGLWDDLFGDISQGTANAALTYEAFRDTPFKMYFLRHDQNDELHFRYQLPHRWYNSPDYVVKPHLHVVPMAAPAAPSTIAFAGQYIWAQRDTPILANASWTAFSPAPTKAITAADEFKHLLINLGDVTPPANPQVSDILLIYLKRDSSGADDYDDNKTGGTGAANLGVLSLDLHYRSWKQGSRGT